MSELSKYRAHYLTEARAQRLIDKGRCPVCEIRLASSYHTDCPYLNEIHRPKS